MAHFDDATANARPFRLDDPEFDMNAYWGRVHHFFRVFNPV